MKAPDRERVRFDDDELAGYVSFEAAGKRLRKSPKTIARWVAEGLRAGDERIRLRAIAIGRNYRVRLADVVEFGAAVIAARQAMSSRQPQRSTEVKREHARGTAR